MTPTFVCNSFYNYGEWETLPWNWHNNHNFTPWGGGLLDAAIRNLLEGKRLEWLQHNPTCCHPTLPRTVFICSGACNGCEFEAWCFHRQLCSVPLPRHVQRHGC
jgi:hypothetical protein